MTAEPPAGDRATTRPRLFLHVGLPKTGTTQLQSVLWANRRGLHKRGVLYPGRRNPAHWLAARDLLGSKAPDVSGAWAELVEEVTTASAPVSVVSHEMFAGLRDRKVNRLMGDFEGFEVHMVLSLRDFSRVVAATWQERAKNREVEPWPDYLRAVTAGPEGKHGFWRLQNAPQILEAWAKVIPAERIHVVTVPPLSADRLLLLKRFTQVLDIDADRLTIPSEEANPSLGAVEIALLQRVNAATTDLDMDAYRRWVKRYFAQTLLAKRPGQLRVVLPESLRSWVEDETRRIRDTVERLGCSVVGSRTLAWAGGSTSSYPPSRRPSYPTAPGCRPPGSTRSLPMHSKPARTRAPPDARSASFTGSKRRRLLRRSWCSPTVTSSPGTSATSSIASERSSLSAGPPCGYR